MNRLRPTLLTLALLPLLGGCILRSSGPDIAACPAPGTPYPDVLAVLGNPARAQFAPDGACEAVWMGSRTLGGAFSLGYSGIGIKMGRTHTAAGGLRLHFGPDGKLRTAEPVGSLDAGWHVWPFGD